MDRVCLASFHVGPAGSADGSHVQGDVDVYVLCTNSKGLHRVIS